MFVLIQVAKYRQAGIGGQEFDLKVLHWLEHVWKFR
jgi:hypothetical protein